MTMRTIVTAQSGLLQVKLPSQSKLKPIGAKRKHISKFSRASRKRFLDYIARLVIRRKTKLVMITLTYGEDYPQPADAKKDLWAFTEWLKWQSPRMSMFWRLEPQKRQAPHFHLLVFGLKYIPADEIAEAWRGIIGIERAANFESPGYEYIPGEQSEYPSGMINDFAQTSVEMVKGKKQAMNYVAKYVAKLAPADKERSDASCFNDVAYLGERSEPSAFSAEGAPGRFWGIINKKYMPFGDKTVWEVTIPDKVFYRWQFAAAQVYPPLGQRPTDTKFKVKNRDEPMPGERFFKTQGFSLYVTDALRWVNYFMVCNIESWEHEVFAASITRLTAN